MGRTLFFKRILKSVLHAGSFFLYERQLFQLDCSTASTTIAIPGCRRLPSDIGYMDIVLKSRRGRNDDIKEPKPDYFILLLLYSEYSGFSLVFLLVLGPKTN